MVERFVSYPGERQAFQPRGPRREREIGPVLVATAAIGGLGLLYLLTRKPQCPEPQFWDPAVNGCIDPGGGPPICSPPYVLQNGVCVQPPPTCNPGYVLRNGVCVKETITCDPGYLLQNGVCVKEQLIFECDPGYEVREGACVYVGPGPGEPPVGGVPPVIYPYTLDAAFADLSVATVDLPGRYRVHSITGSIRCYVADDRCWTCFCPGLADSFIDVYAVDTVKLDETKLGNMNFGTWDIGGAGGDIRDRFFAFSPTLVMNRIRFEAAPGCITQLVGSRVFTPYVQAVSMTLTLEEV